MRLLPVFPLLCALILLFSRPANAQENGPPPLPAETTTPAVRTGFGLALDGGTNVATPFLGAQIGWRFARADFFELYLDYAYGAAISEFSFHTFGAGTRTFFFSRGRVELFHQALLGFGVSAGGTTDVPNRDLGQRLLGAFMTQGLGVDVAVTGGLHASFALSTGYPVWLRPELALRYRF